MGLLRGEFVVRFEHGPFVWFGEDAVLRRRGQLVDRVVSWGRLDEAPGVDEDGDAIPTAG